MRFRSNIILDIPQYYFHMAAILKNGCHFFPAEYRQGCPPRSCAGKSPEHVDTQHVFTTAHARWTPKTGFYIIAGSTYLLKTFLFRQIGMLLLMISLRFPNAL